MISNTLKQLGIPSANEGPIEKEYIERYIIMRLTGLAPFDDLVESDDSFLNIAQTMIKNFRERERLFNTELCPSDQRIQRFITNYFQKVKNVPKAELPSRTFTLDFHGIARELSLPINENHYASEYVQSYRVKQGVLHNPKNDRRTTKGVFHIAEGGLPIPYDKKAVPIETAAYILHKACNAEGDIMNLPYTVNKPNPVKTWVSLLLRPIVCPEVPGITPEKSMEIRFFTPGSLVSNLDFVESIFGNGGSPYHFFNDAGLDVEHWTGHTGCVILAPQLTSLTKKECGLPHISKATERQKRDGMCWESENELYNDGSAFKLTIRTEEGVIVTVIADNYFGYSKKEVKTQIGYAANLYGNCEEEHAGGAYVFPSYNQGDKHITKVQNINNSFANITTRFSEIMDVQPEGYAIDRTFPHIVYVPENAVFDLVKQTVSWTKNEESFKIKFLPKKHYVLPNGSKFRMEKVPGTQNYRLVETLGEGTLFHKPCTVSGGGKSEISKSLADSIFTGSFFIKDFEKDMERVKEIINFDYSKRFKNSTEPIPFSRGFLSTKRSMGSVIKLLTPSPDFTDKYNKWLEEVPQYIKGIAFIIKRFYQESWVDNWKEHFSVDILNGQLGNELKYNNRKLVARYLRVGFDENSNWRTFKLRQDFVHSTKAQIEDDITASIVLPCSTKKGEDPLSVKFVQNCEYRFFQRPDEAIVRGFDKKAEEDLSSPNTFVSNFEPLTIQNAKDIVEDTINFEKFTQPMHDFIQDIAENEDTEYFVSSAHPRVIDGKPSKNVRYLQTRSDLLNPAESYLTEIGLRFARNIPFGQPLYTPVQAVLPGRRNNPAEKGIRPLAVYNPLHYQELPELFMDFICSLTGKSPSTTGAGSEGALTKAPFNALLPITDLNNALISYILTGYKGFSTPAGYIGSKFRVDHDLSLLLPELLARLQPFEKDPDLMIASGFLEKINDFKHKNKLVKASVLGYRITSKFVNTYFGRVFENPNVVFTEEMLQPELQSMEEFVDGVNNIVDAQKKVAAQYFEDGSYELAIPPLKALLSIMVNGHYENKTLEDKEIRNMFTYEYLIDSDFYAERLTRKQIQDVQLWEEHVKYLEHMISVFGEKIDEDSKNILLEKLRYAKEERERNSSYEYLKSLKGCIGRDRVEL